MQHVNVTLEKPRKYLNLNTIKVIFSSALLVFFELYDHIPMSFYGCVWHHFHSSFEMHLNIFRYNFCELLSRRRQVAFLKLRVSKIMLSSYVTHSKIYLQKYAFRDFLPFIVFGTDNVSRFSIDMLHLEFQETKMVFLRLFNIIISLRID